jgi:hypothetical protein
VDHAIASVANELRQLDDVIIVHPDTNIEPKIVGCGIGEKHEQFPRIASSAHITARPISVDSCAVINALWPSLPRFFKSTISATLSSYSLNSRLFA